MFLQDNIVNLFGIRLASASVAIYPASTQSAVPISGAPSGSAIATLSTDVSGNFAFESSTVSGADFHLYVTPAGGTPSWFYHYRPLYADYQDLQTSGLQVGTNIGTGSGGTGTTIGGGVTLSSAWLPCAGWTRVTLFAKCSVAGSATLNIAPTPSASQSIGTGGSVLLSPLTLSAGVYLATTVSVNAASYIQVQVTNTTGGSGTANAYLHLERAI